MSAFAFLSHKAWLFWALLSQRKLGLSFSLVTSYHLWLASCSVSLGHFCIILRVAWTTTAWQVLMRLSWWLASHHQLLLCTLSRASSLAVSSLTFSVFRRNLTALWTRSLSLHTREIDFWSGLFSAQMCTLQDHLGLKFWSYSFWAFCWFRSSVVLEIALHMFQG